MLQKIKILDEKLDILDEIDNNKFMFENFNQINFEIDKLLVEIKSNELTNEQYCFSRDHLNIIKKLLNKIEKLETKISHKAHLFESFSKSNA